MKRLSAVIVALVTLVAQVAHAQAIIRPGGGGAWDIAFGLGLEPFASRSAGPDLQQAIQGYVEGAAQATREVQEARAAFFAQYPNGPRLAETRAAYERALYMKDMAILSYYFVNFANLPVAQILQRVAPIDGGIHPTARIAFMNWVEEVQEQIRGRGGFSELLTAMIRAAASAPTLGTYKAYVQERNLAEFELVGFEVLVPTRWSDVAKNDDPRFFAYAMLHEASSFDRTATISDRVERLERRLTGLVAEHGEEKVLDVADRLMRHPRAQRDFAAEERTGQHRVYIEAADGDLLFPVEVETAYALGCSDVDVVRCFMQILGEQEQIPRQPDLDTDWWRGLAGRWNGVTEGVAPQRSFTLAVNTAGERGSASWWTSDGLVNGAVQLNVSRSGGITMMIGGYSGDATLRLQVAVDENSMSGDLLLSPLFPAPWKGGGVRVRLTRQ